MEYITTRQEKCGTGPGNGLIGGIDFGRMEDP